MESRLGVRRSHVQSTKIPTRVVVHEATAQEERPAFPRFAAVRLNHTCGSSRAPVTRLCRRPRPRSSRTCLLKDSVRRASSRGRGFEESHHEITISRQFDQSASSASFCTLDSAAFVSISFPRFHAPSPTSYYCFSLVLLKTAGNRRIFVTVKWVQWVIDKNFSVAD